MNTTVQDLKIGDKIMPPKREIQLWMAQTMQEKGLSEKDLALTISDIREGKPDKNGRWIIIKARYSPAWTRDYADPTAEHYFPFKARPYTPWTLVT